MGTFKAIELRGAKRTGREFQFEVETRQAAVDALVAELGLAPDIAHADPARTLVQIGDVRWSIVAIQKQTTIAENSSLRRGGAKHKQVR